MRFADLYTKVILAVIAASLAWSTLARFRTSAVHAQSTSAQYAVEEITADFSANEHTKSLEAAINSAAKGRQLVAVIPAGQPARYYLAVFTQSR
jgi:hypothetical protein